MITVINNRRTQPIRIMKEDGMLKWSLAYIVVGKNYDGGKRPCYM